jgi:hypothetical protein
MKLRSGMLDKLSTCREGPLPEVEEILAAPLWLRAWPSVRHFRQSISGFILDTTWKMTFWHRVLPGQTIIKKMQRSLETLKTLIVYALFKILSSAAYEVHRQDCHLDAHLSISSRAYLWCPRPWPWRPLRPLQHARSSYFEDAEKGTESVRKECEGYCLKHCYWAMQALIQVKQTRS